MCAFDPDNSREIHSRFFWKVVGQARASRRGQVVSAKLDREQLSEDASELQEKASVFENTMTLVARAQSANRPFKEHLNLRAIRQAHFFRLD